MYVREIGVWLGEENGDKRRRKEGKTKRVKGEGKRE